jgi:peroxiredoxin Q/BCP
VLGLSPDEPADLLKWKKKESLPYDLLSDPDHAVLDAWGVWGEKSMYGKKYMGVQRATFLIDPEGQVAKVFPKVSPKTHDDVVLDALSELASA